LPPNLISCFKCSFFFKSLSQQTSSLFTDKLPQSLLENKLYQFPGNKFNNCLEDEPNQTAPAKTSQNLAIARFCDAGNSNPKAK